jgi:16S rRNA processing protein RimM
MTEPAGHVLVGALAGAFGVRGEVRLKSFCAEPRAIADYAPLVSEDGRSFSVTLTRQLQGAFAARLAGVDSREAAEALRGVRLYAPRDRLPPLGEDEYYHADLIGMVVYDAGGARIGRVRAVNDYGAGDVIEILRRGEEAELVLPFTRAAVPTIDLAGKRMVVDPPPEPDE